MRPLGPRESDAILGAMRQVALAGGRPLSRADTASIVAAGHWLLRRGERFDISDLPGIGPADLVAALKGERALGQEAVKYLAIMALVDGALDHDKIRRVLEYARALDVEADYLTDLVEAASGHMAWVVADMTRKNFDSVISHSSEGLDPVAWITPYAGDKADPALVARYEALDKLPDNSFGKALWRFDNDVATPAQGGHDPDEFWHAWARGQEMTVDLFDPGWDVWQWVEHDLDELRRTWNVTPPGHSGR